jgi:hypothetical protein
MPSGMGALDLEMDCCKACKPLENRAVALEGPWHSLCLRVSPLGNAPGAILRSLVKEVGVAITSDMHTRYGHGRQALRFLSDH